MKLNLVLVSLVIIIVTSLFINLDCYDDEDQYGGADAQQPVALPPVTPPPPAPVLAQPQPPVAPTPAAPVKAPAPVVPGPLAAKIGGDVFSVSNNTFAGMNPGFLQISVNGDNMELNSLVVNNGRLISMGDVVVNRKTKTISVFIKEDGTAGSKNAVRLTNNNIIRDVNAFQFTHPNLIKLLITQWITPKPEFKKLLTDHKIQDPSTFESKTPTLATTTTTKPGDIKLKDKKGIEHEYNVAFVGDDIIITKSDKTGLTANRSEYMLGHGKNNSYSTMHSFTTLHNGRIVSAENLSANLAHLWMFPHDTLVRNKLKQMASPTLTAIVNRITTNPYRYVVVKTASGQPAVMVINNQSGKIVDMSGSKVKHDISLLHQPRTDEAQRAKILKEKRAYNCDTIAGAHQYLSDLFYVPDLKGCSYASYN